MKDEFIIIYAAVIILKKCGNLDFSSGFYQIYS